MEQLSCATGILVLQRTSREVGLIAPIALNVSPLEQQPMTNLFARFVREEEGQDLIEYSLLAALIAVACILAMQTLAGDINGIFARIGAALQAA